MITANNLTNERLPNAVFVGDCLLANVATGVEPSNVSDISCREFSFGVTRSAVIGSIHSVFSGSVSHVDELIAQEEVIRAVAGRVIAPVEDKQPIGDRTVMKFPREAISSDLSFAPATPTQLPIATWEDGSLPAPTPIFTLDHFAPETFSQRASHGDKYSGRLDN